jgi:hypothetical protein
MDGKTCMEGIYLMPSFGKYEVLAEVLEALNRG